MKLITCITLFNGIEYLDRCVDQFLKFSDSVVICYQDISHTGERRRVGDEVIPRYENHPRVIIDKYIPSRKLNFKANERKKHTQMISVARRAGATHFIMAAVDHFYDENEVNNFKEVASKYDITLTRVHTYYKEPTWQVTPLVDFFMPFICKMDYATVVKKVPGFPVFVDPAVQIWPYKTFKIFEENEICVHNYSMIRTDIHEKYKNRYIPMKWTEGKIRRLINEYENYDIEGNCLFSTGGNVQLTL